MRGDVMTHSLENHFLAEMTVWFTVVTFHQLGTKGHLTNPSICTDVLPELSQLADPLRKFLVSYQVRICGEKKTT